MVVFVTILIENGKLVSENVEKRGVDLFKAMRSEVVVVMSEPVLERTLVTA